MTVAPALRLPMVADDLSSTADVLRFVRDALHAMAQEDSTTSAGAARGLYAILSGQIAQLDVVVGEVTEAAAVIVGDAAMRGKEAPGILPRRSQ